MGSESIAHEAEDQIGYRLRGHEGSRNNYCFSKIQLIGQKRLSIETKHLLLAKARLSFFAAKTLQKWPLAFATGGL